MKKYFVLIFALFVTPVLFIGWVWLQIPTETEVKGCMTTKMFKINLCPKSKNYVHLRDISPYLIKAVVLTEDSLFWKHGGFDWDSIKRNYEENKRLGRYRRGGSTISQQLAKNLYLTSEKTMIRKGLEALITMKLEKALSKREILERYLNVVEFGKNIYGVKAASQHYFKKHPSQLNVVESAFLAMVLPNPKKYSASYYNKSLTPFAANRMKQIIDNMYTYQRITEDDYSMALVQLETFFQPEQALLEASPEVAPEMDEDLTLEGLEKEAAEEDRF